MTRAIIKTRLEAEVAHARSNQRASKERGHVTPHLKSEILSVGPSSTISRLPRQHKLHFASMNFFIFQLIPLLFRCPYSPLTLLYIHISTAKLSPRQSRLDGTHGWRGKRLAKINLRALTFWSSTSLVLSRLQTDPDALALRVWV